MIFFYCVTGPQTGHTSPEHVHDDYRVCADCIPDGFEDLEVGARIMLQRAPLLDDDDKAYCDHCNETWLVVDPS